MPCQRYIMKIKTLTNLTCNHRQVRQNKDIIYDCVCLHLQSFQQGFSAAKSGSVPSTESASSRLHSHYLLSSCSWCSYALYRHLKGILLLNFTLLITYQMSSCVLVHNLFRATQHVLEEREQFAIYLFSISYSPNMIFREKILENFRL